MIDGIERFPIYRETPQTEKEEFMSKYRLAGRNKSIYCGMVRNKTRRNEIVREKVIQKNMGNVFFKKFGDC